MKIACEKSRAFNIVVVSYLTLGIPSRSNVILHTYKILLLVQALWVMKTTWMKSCAPKLVGGGGGGGGGGSNLIFGSIIGVEYG